MKKEVKPNKAYRLTAPERETICVKSDEDDFWTVTTASPKYIHKLEKLGYEAAETSVYGYKQFIVREGGVGFRSKQKKQMSEARKKALSQSISRSKSSSTTQNLTDKKEKPCQS
jgi:hypothetical protein